MFKTKEEDYKCYVCGKQIPQPNDYICLGYGYCSNECCDKHISEQVNKGDIFLSPIVPLIVTPLIISKMEK